jgi:glycosyltransferase involved in cell wall biosynthesis
MNLNGHRESSQHELDILIPVYNERENIIAVMKSLERHVITPFRVLICYDFDEDNTLLELKKFSSSRFEIIPVKNMGHGAHGAVLTGFAFSKALAAIVFPADDTFNTSILDKMFAKFKEGNDIVAASRFMEGGSMEGCPFLKSILVRAASLTLNRIARIPIKDSSNGFRLFSRRLLDSVVIESSVGFSYSIELLVKCHRLGWNMAEVPALWFERKHGKSRFSVLKWIPYYLRWYFYAFETTYLKRGKGTVALNKQF